MKTLILMRHAKSSWKYDDLSDFERPLNERGRRDAPLMGGRLASRGFTPDLVVTSPAIRAYTTARLVSEQLSYDLSTIMILANLYESGVREYSEAIRSLPQKHSRVLLIGHNPTLSDLASRLCSEFTGDMPTSCLAVMTFDIDDWIHLQDGTAHLQYVDSPKRSAP